MKKFTLQLVTTEIGNTIVSAELELRSECVCSYRKDSAGRTIKRHGVFNNGNQLTNDGCALLEVRGGKIIESGGFDPTVSVSDESISTIPLQVEQHVVIYFPSINLVQVTINHNCEPEVLFL